MGGFMEAFKAVGSEFFRPSSYSNDSALSCVHYKFLTGIFLFCSILSGLTTWLTAIECTKPDLSNVDPKLINQYCYSNSTFIIEGQPDGEATSHGMFNKHSNDSNIAVYLRYYQWVFLVLLLQAASFQIPRLFWKLLENGRMKKMIARLEEMDDTKEGERQQKIGGLVQYFCNQRQLDSFESYFSSYAFCQTLYLVNLIIQIAIANWFLNGSFVGLVPRLAFLGGESELNAVFPKKGKCEYPNYGTGGGKQTINVDCVLPQNVVFGPIYICLWLIMLTALVLSLVQVAMVVVEWVSPKFRAYWITADFSEPELKDPFETPSTYLVLRFFKKNVENVVFGEFFDMAMRDRAVA